jgi:uncharacterized protein YkwD
MDQSLRQRTSSASPTRFSRLGALLVPEVSFPWTISRNRQKVLGFAAMAVSLVLISAPFVLNVDSDVVAKAQTVEVDSAINITPVITEMDTVDDVIVALNALRSSAQIALVEPDSQLQGGAQAWASNVADSASVRTDRSLRAMLDNRSSIGEFVVAAPSLPIAYERLLAIPSQRAQLLAPTTRALGVGVQTLGAKTYLVLRFGTQ